MRLPETAHTSRPWRIHEIAPDFQVEDVWQVPTPGGPGDFPFLVRQFAEGGDPGSLGPTTLYRVLFAIRWKLGALLGWDKPERGLGTRVASLRDRLPQDLREASPEAETLGPFRSVYELPDEWAAEIANGTVHGVLHLGWVPDEKGEGYHAQMAVLVKPNGTLGRVYMAGIKPFRYLGVYPALLRAVGRRWEETAAERAAA